MIEPSTPAGGSDVESAGGAATDDEPTIALDKVAEGISADNSTDDDGTEDAAAAAEDVETESTESADGSSADTDTDVATDTAA